jgi:diguanylate cyclase (GGDEF)-like protein/PAS domain S-box-containing protein
MIPPDTPADEVDRIAELHSLEILDSDREERFDRLTRLATRLLDVPIALVSLVDTDRQWFKSAIGLDTTETSREASFCAHAINAPELFEIPDATLDERFVDNPLVTGDPGIRFYAGEPISGPGGHRLGTLCVIDRRPRSFTDEDRQILRDLAGLVDQELANTTLADALRRLRETEARFEASFEKAPIGMAMIGLEDHNFGVLIDVNEALADLAGDPDRLAVGLPFGSTVHDDDLPLLQEKTRAAQRGEVDHLDAEVRLYRLNGDMLWVRIRAAAVQGETGTPAYAIVHINDISDRKRAEQRRDELEADLERQALHDPLTGLPNRRLLMDRLGLALRALPRDPAPVAVMYLDIDRFKRVNDTWGHEAGDELIKVAGRRLSESIRPDDTAGRIGGDEFVLICPKVAGVDDALRIAERVRVAFVEPIDLGPASVSLTISGGIAVSHDPSAEPDGLLRAADEALYLAKKAGRDRFEVAEGVSRGDASVASASVSPE